MTETYEEARIRAAKNVNACIGKMQSGSNSDAMTALQCLIEGMYLAQDDDSESIDAGVHIGVIAGPTPDPRLDLSPLEIAVTRQKRVESCPTLLLPYYPEGGWYGA